MLPEIPKALTPARTPQGHVWVEGDNAAVSEDSRSAYGPIPAALIEGRVLTVLWPPSEMGPVELSYPQSRLLVCNPHPFEDNR